MSVQATTNTINISTPVPSLVKLCEKKVGISIDLIKRWFAFDPHFAMNELQRYMKTKTLNPSLCIKYLSPDKTFYIRITTIFMRTLVESFPCDYVYDFSKEMKVPLFERDQLKIHSLAKHIFLFYQDGGTRENLIAALMQLGAFDTIPNEIQKELCEAILDKSENIYKGTSYDLSEHRKSLRESFHWRIYTLNNAKFAVTEPQKIFNRLVSNTPISNGQSEKIKSFGKRFAVDSLLIHLESLKKLSDKKLSEDDFFRFVEASIKIITPFLKIAVASYSKNQHVNILQSDSILKFNPKETPNASLVCTLLEVCLKNMGFNTSHFSTSIYWRRDIDNRYSPCFYHCIVQVQDNLSGISVIVDPMYKFYLQNVDHLPEEDILILKPQDVFQKRSSFIKKADQKLHANIKKLWDLNDGYEKVYFNGSAELILSPMEGYDESVGPSRKNLHALFDKLGLKEQLQIYDSKKIADALHQVYKSLYHDFPQQNTELALSLLEKLRCLPSGATRLCSDLLHLDPRSFVFLKAETVGFYQSIKAQVNPSDREGVVTIYPACGTDLMAPFLATNPTHLFMVDNLKIDYKNLMDIRSIMQSKTKCMKLFQDVKPYIDHKLQQGGVTTDIVWTNPVNNIMMEITAFNPDLSTIEIIPAPEFNGFTISFKWQYFGFKNETSSRHRKITFVQADILKPDSYPEGLKKVLDNGIDFYFQKASEELPRNYAKFLPGIISAIKPNGAILINDLDRYGMKQDSGKFWRKSFVALEDSPLTKAYRNMHQNLFMDFKTSVNVDTSKVNLQDYWHYWSMLDVYKKKK